MKKILSKKYRWRFAARLAVPLAALILTGQGCSETMSFKTQDTETGEARTYDLGYAHAGPTPNVVTISLAETTPQQRLASASAKQVQASSLAYESKFSLAGISPRSQTPDNSIANLQSKINLTDEAADHFIQTNQAIVAGQPTNYELANWWARVPSQLEAAKKKAESRLAEMRRVRETKQSAYFEGLKARTAADADAYAKLLAQLEITLGKML